MGCGLNKQKSRDVCISAKIILQHIVYFNAFFKYFFKFVLCLLMPPLILLQRFRSEKDEREKDGEETDQEDLDVNSEGKYSVKTYGDFPSSYMFFVSLN